MHDLKLTNIAVLDIFRAKLQFSIQLGNERLLEITEIILLFISTNHNVQLCSLQELSVVSEELKWMLQKDLA